MEIFTPAEIVKILAPLTDNPNVPDKEGRTPIYLASFYGCIEIVKILAPLTDNPNSADEDGVTPIHSAVCNGHIEIVNILAPLTDNPILMLQKKRKYSKFCYRQCRNSNNPSIIQLSEKQQLKKL